MSRTIEADMNASSPVSGRPAAGSERGWRRMLLAVCATLLLACADYDGAEAEEVGMHEVLAQQSAPVVTPTKQATTSLATEERSVPVAITANFGSGCEGRLKPNPEQEKLGVLEVTFESYRIKFAPPDASIYDTKDCLIRLRVSGVAGYQYAIQSVVFNGMANLFSPQARAIIDANVWWSGRRPVFSNRTMQELAPRHLGTWSHDDSIVVANSSSRCFASSRDVDEITLYTSLSLLNPDPKLPAELAMVAATASASVLIDLNPTRCQ